MKNKNIRRTWIFLLFFSLTRLALGQETYDTLIKRVPGLYIHNLNTLALDNANVLFIQYYLDKNDSGIIDFLEVSTRYDSIRENKVYFESLDININSSAESVDGGILFTGRIWVTSGYHGFVAKADKNYHIIWTVIFTGNYKYNKGNHIIETSGKNIVISGRSYDGINDEFIFLKYSPAGNREWFIQSDFYPIEEPGNIIETNNNNFLSVGMVYENYRYKTEIYQISSSGKVTFRKLFEDEQGLSCKSICPAGDGNFYLAAILGKNNPDYRQYLQILKITENGDIIWKKAYPELFPEYSLEPIKMTPLNDGNFLIQSDKININLYYDYSISLLKINSQGDILWSRSHLGELNDNRGNVLPLKNNMFFYTTTSGFYYSSFSEQYYIALLNKDGKGRLPVGLADYNPSIKFIEEDKNGHNRLSFNDEIFLDYDIDIYKETSLNLFSKIGQASFTDSYFSDENSLAIQNSDNYKIRYRMGGVYSVDYNEKNSIHLYATMFDSLSWKLDWNMFLQNNAGADGYRILEGKDKNKMYSIHNNDSLELTYTIHYPSFGQMYYQIEAYQKLNGKQYPLARSNFISFYNYNSATEPKDVPIVIYPNPANEFIIIQSAETQIYYLLNNKGQQLQEGKSIPGMFKIKIPDLPSAYYFLYLAGTNQVYKIIKSKR